MKVTNNALESGLAIVANGDTHAAITSGQYVYVKNHSSLTEGLYKATTAIEADGALSGKVSSANGELNGIASAIGNVSHVYAFPDWATSKATHNADKSYVTSIVNGMPGYSVVFDYNSSGTEWGYVIIRGSYLAVALRVSHIGNLQVAGANFNSTGVCTNENWTPWQEATCTAQPY